MTKEKAIATKSETVIQPANQSVTMIGMIQQAAADPATDVATMESLWKMKQEIDAKEAETEFNLAMGIAQSQMRTIGVDCANPQTRSKYASYAKLDKALRPIYTGEGFALSFNSEATQDPDLILILCYVTHRSGHSRTYTIPVPTDGKGPKGNNVMTKTHATGAATQYGMRYLLKMIFNVAVGEEDDDGNLNQPVIFIDDGQQKTIKKMLKDNDLSETIFMSWLDKAIPNSNGIESIPVNLYSKVIDKINESINKKVKK